MEIKAVEFPYSNEITVVSKKQFDVHKKLYAGYVSKANEIAVALKGLKDASGNTTYSVYRGLKKGQSYALDGVILHELYFKNLGGEHLEPGKALQEKLKHCYGSYEMWEKDFKACATSARGWAILAYEQRTDSLVNMLLDTHDEGIITGAFPLLVLDMYEHAYFIDYANNKDEYFAKFMDNIDWNCVNERYETVLYCGQKRL